MQKGQQHLFYEVDVYVRMYAYLFIFNIYLFLSTKLLVVAEVLKQEVYMSNIICVQECKLALRESSLYSMAKG